MSLALSDKNEEVREAVAFFGGLQGLSRSPERVKEALQERKNAVKPTRVPIHVVDTQGRPIKGAIVSTFFAREADSEPSFSVPEPLEAATSDARGELALKLAVPAHRDADGIYATRQDGNLPIVGLQKVSREEIWDGKSVTIVMHPACRVRLRVECPALGEFAKKYHVDDGGENWWRAAYVWLGENHRAPRPLFTSSTTGQLEFLLPPGRFLVRTGAVPVRGHQRRVFRSSHRSVPQVRPWAGTRALERAPCDPAGRHHHHDSGSRADQQPGGASDPLRSDRPTDHARDKERTGKPLLRTNLDGDCDLRTAGAIGS
jgi:hypothetical protein